MAFLYSFLFIAACCVAAPWYALQALLRSDIRRGFGERFGRLPQELLADRRPTIWVHAVSVGEVRAARSILQGLADDHPDHRLVLSVTTPSGRRVASDPNLPVDGVFHLPLDFPWIPPRVLDALNCRMFICMETEIWPNLLAACEQKQIPAIILNGRISDRSFRNYRRLRFFLKTVLRRLRFAGMQTWEDAERLTWMGMPVHRMEVTGSVKFDVEIPPLPADHPAVRLMESHHGPVWIAASTWPGEEAAVLRAAAALWKSHPDLLVVIAPRKPERFHEVSRLLNESGHPWVRRTALTEDSSRARVLLLDTIGELASLYHHADLAFVGGSLAAMGGHNPIEPASCSVPVLFGGHMENFRRVSHLLLQGGGAAQVRDAEDLEREVRRLLDDPKLRQTLGRHARAVVDLNGGAVTASLRIVRHFLKQEGPGPRRLLPVQHHPHEGSLPMESGADHS